MTTISQLPVRRVERAAGRALPVDQWPATVPAVAQLLADGLDLGPATVLVGENGTGKSTIVEAIATAYGLQPAGGSSHALPGEARLDQSPLAASLQLVRGAGASKWGFFLRAETMDGWFDEQVRESLGPNLLTLSHGESFHALLGTTRFTGPGFYLFDEPESALSFTAQLSLVGQLHEIASSPRAQVVLATHSPVLAALPGARVLELGDWGMQETPWEELAMVDHHRRFLSAPQAYLRHVVTDPTG